jgi:hypothetical protein
MSDRATQQLRVGEPGCLLGVVSNIFPESQDFHDWRRMNGSGVETTYAMRDCWCNCVPAGLGLDKISAHSRHRTIATLMLYVDEHDRHRTQTTLADLVAGTLTN